MKKILIVAALLATAVVPATPSFAAMATPKASPFTCWFMPMNADCQAMMKDHHMHMPMMHMAPPAPMKIAAPIMPKMTLPMMPTCTKAPAGSGHLLDCTKMSKM
jgi:hypothetical protein